MEYIQQVLGGLNGKTIALATAALTLLYTGVSTLVQWSRLRHIPGPALATVSYLWGMRMIRTGNAWNICSSEQKKYGKIMRVGPDAVMAYDPDTILRIHSARSTYTRGGWYQTIRFDPRGDSVFSTMDTAKHDKRKAKLASGYTGKGLLDLESNIDIAIAELVGVLKKRSAKGPTKLNIGRTLQYFQVDLITKAGMGKSWGDLPDDRDHFGYLEDTDKTLSFIQSMAWSPLASKILTSDWFLKVFGPNTKDEKGLGRFLGLLEETVKERFASKDVGDGSTMLDEWIKHGLTAEECQLDMSLQVPAGSETSISTIRGIMLLLMTSPPVYYRLKKEINQGIADGRISSPITHEEAKQLPYLQAVILEGMRIMPPVVVGFPKRVPPEGDTLAGHYLPGGTDVYQNYGLMLENPEVFGEDSEIFRPERLLQGNPDEIALMKRTIDLVFGFGRFGCLGKVLAQIEMNKIFVELLREFDFQLLNPEKPWERKGYATFAINGFYAFVSASEESK